MYSCVRVYQVTVKVVLNLNSMINYRWCWNTAVRPIYVEPIIQYYEF